MARIESGRVDQPSASRVDSVKPNRAKSIENVPG